MNFREFGMAASMENVTLSPLLDTIFVARTDGMLLSYSFLVLTALVCVYYGAYRSITRQEEQVEAGERPDVLTAKDGELFSMHEHRFSPGLRFF